MEIAISKDVQSAELSISELSTWLPNEKEPKSSSTTRAVNVQLPVVVGTSVWFHITILLISKANVLG